MVDLHLAFSFCRSVGRTLFTCHCSTFNLKGVVIVTTNGIPSIAIELSLAGRLSKGGFEMNSQHQMAIEMIRCEIIRYPVHAQFQVQSHTVDAPSKTGDVCLSHQNGTTEEVYRKKNKFPARFPTHRAAKQPRFMLWMHA